jgi:hypothetical protein
LRKNTKTQKESLVFGELFCNSGAGLSGMALKGLRSLYLSEEDQILKKAVELLWLTAPSL